MTVIDEIKNEYLFTRLRSVAAAVVLCGAIAVTSPATATSPQPDQVTAWHLSVLDRFAAAEERYAAIIEAGGWPRVPEGPTLEIGMIDRRVSALRRRLQVSGDIPPSNVPPPSFFDREVEAGVRVFQKRHGIEVDGRVGDRTLAELNVPAEARLNMLRRNAARIAAFQAPISPYVLVNIPGFEGRVIDGSETRLTTPVVVGLPDWPTPQLQSSISHIVVNPYWTVPYSIQSRELIPAVRRDPNYMTKQNLRVYFGDPSPARELDPSLIDWSSPDASSYRLRQDPGRGNALGNLKFVFKNRHSVYLHDTPKKHLFSRAMRALSHGCVRVGKPFELAQLLLEGQWDASRISSAIDSGRHSWVPLNRPVPVHLVYWTAWVAEDGAVQFRPDIYGQDRGGVPAANVRKTTQQAQRL